MKKALFIIIILSCLIINAQEKAKDTLFFKYDKRYIRERVIDTNIYYVLKDSNSDGTFFFQGMETFIDMNPKKILCLKKYVRNSQYYDKSRKRKLYDYGLYEHLNNYIIFLVKKGEFIKLKSSYEIE